MIRKLSFLSLVILLFASCKQKNNKRFDEEKNITALPAGDEKFLSLKDTAQKYIGEFIEAFQKNAADTNYYFTIKSDYTENETHEHMWSVPISYTKGGFKCIFTDSAYNLTNVQTGDTVLIKSRDIEDWVIYNYFEGTKRGSFSEKYLKGEE